jgi:hypothetical protein
MAARSARIAASSAATSIATGASHITRGGYGRTEQKHTGPGARPGPVEGSGSIAAAGQADPRIRT